MSSEEIWKDIQGFEGIYQVSNIGRVRVLDRYIIRCAGQKKENKYLAKGRVMKPSFDSVTGYYGLTLCKEGIKTSFKIHTLVAVAFIPNPENKSQVNHIGKDAQGKINKLDNMVISLEWTTPSENMRHAYDNGLYDKSIEKALVGRLILNNQTGVFYFSCREAANAHGLKRHVVQRSLTGIISNKTDLIYV